MTAVGWIPAPAPDTDPAFAGMTKLLVLCSFAKVSEAQSSKGKDEYRLTIEAESSKLKGKISLEAISILKIRNRAHIYFSRSLRCNSVCISRRPSTISKTYTVSPITR